MEYQLEGSEHVARKIKKHPLVLFGMLLPYIVLAFLPLILFQGLSGFLAGTPQLAHSLSLSSPGSTLLLGLWWLFIWMLAYAAVMRYLLTLWVITNTRIIEITQRGFFQREVSSFLINRVQDITTDTDGIFGTIFGFGSLRIETAGEASQGFSMSGVAFPNDIRNLIMHEISEMHADSGPVGV